MAKTTVQLFQSSLVGSKGEPLKGDTSESLNYRLNAPLGEKSPNSSSISSPLKSTGDVYDVFLSSMDGDPPLLLPLVSLRNPWKKPDVNHFVDLLVPGFPHSFKYHINVI